MNEPTTGGPAFPSTLQYFPKDTNYEEAAGMTLRDYFATAALQGNIASLTEEDLFNPSIAAEWSYKVADEMLKARVKQ